MNLFSDLEFSAGKTVLVLCTVLALAVIDITRRIERRSTHILFATVLGTILSVGMIQSVDVFLSNTTFASPYATAFGLLLTVLLWKSLFGPWDVQTKTYLLGSFLFWICLKLYWDSTGEEHLARSIAALTALIPAAVWCWLFLKYHRERLEVVILFFLSGMLSTAPILFYDGLVRRNIEMQFFLFRLKPESFSQTTQSFVAGQLTAQPTTASVLIATLLSFVFVGVIEEFSKYWVVTKSGKGIFTSIDDVMQLSIIVAIGFAFAENVINPMYFMSFVRTSLLHSSPPDVMTFVSNVMGRSVLTSMVHIVSTGVMGYFLGLAIFAGPILEEEHRTKRAHKWICALHSMLRLREVSIYRVHMLSVGLLSAIVLHGLFNFLVTLPEVLPGNPRTLAEMFSSNSAVLESIPVLLVPALLYVVGGFWLLTTLFMRTNNMVERGHVLAREEVV